MFLSADIPPHKLDNPTVREFFKKYCKEDLPTETSVRKSYIPEVYEQKMTQLRAAFTDKYVWVSIDETTDAAGRYVVNVIAGPLDGSSTSYLIDVQYVQSSNHSTIAHVLIEALKNLLGSEQAMNKVLVLLTDAASYMLKMAKGVAALLPNCIHITCLAHGIHRIAESIRTLYPLVDKLVSQVKKVFVKAASRRSLFQEVNPGLPLPPEPVTTRWGTWVSAVTYYAQHFEAVQNALNALDSNDAAAIATAQDLMNSKQLREDLAYIAANFSHIPRVIQELQRKDMHAPAALRAFIDFSETVQSHPALKEKMEAVIKRNSLLSKLSAILRVTVPDSPLVPGDTDVSAFLPAAIIAFAKAPLTTVEVERSFSMYKAVLRWNRRSFTAENLRLYFVIHCNNNN